MQLNCALSAALNPSSAPNPLRTVPSASECSASEMYQLAKFSCTACAVAERTAFALLRTCKPTKISEAMTPTAAMLWLR